MTLRRRLFDWSLAGLLLASLLGLSQAAEGPGRPNVALIIADDMAWDDCGAFGNPKVRTPNIDRLAREGLRFDRAFVTASSCSPSRASLLTGRYPHGTDAEEPTFLRRLGDGQRDPEQPVLECTGLFRSRLLVEHLEIQPDLMHELRGLGRAVLGLWQLELLLGCLAVLELGRDRRDQI